MSRFLRVLLYRIILPAIPFVILTLILVGLLYWNWSVTLFGLYLIIGGWFAFILASRSSEFPDYISEPQAHTRAILQNEASKIIQSRFSLLTKIRNRTSEILEYVMFATCWPIPFIYPYLYPLLYPLGRGLDSKFYLRYANPPFAVTVLLLLVLNHLVYQFSNNIFSSFHMYFMVLFMLHVAARQLSYIANSDSLPTVLRKSPGNPYLLFLLILGLDFASLVLGFGAIKALSAGVSLTLSDFKEVTAEIFRFRKIQSILEGSDLQIYDYAVGGVGLLYYVAVIKTAVKFREFRRTDDDYHALARANLNYGLFEQTLKLLQRIRTKTWVTMQYLAVANWGLNRMEEALSQAQIAVCLEENLVRPFKGSNPESGLHLLLTSFYVMELAPIGREQIIWLAKTAIEKRVSDWFLAGLLNTSGFDFPPDKVKKIFASKQNLDNYPLSYSTVLINNERFSEARKLLNKTKVAGPVHKIHKRCLAFYAHLGDTSLSLERRGQYILSEWWESSFEEIKNLIPRAIDDHEKFLIATQLAGVSRVALIGVLPLAEECSKISVEILQSIDEEPIKEAGLQMVERLEEEVNAIAKMYPSKQFVEKLSIEDRLSLLTHHAVKSSSQIYGTSPI